MKTRYVVRLLLVWLTLWMGSARADSAGVYSIEADDLQGQPQSLQQYQGKPLVLNFWATWCPPCVQEMPELDELSQLHPEVQFVGLAIDTQRNVQRFLENVPVSYDLYVTGHRGVQMMKNLGNTPGGIPYTVVLQADGAVVEQVLGQINQADLNQILLDLKN